MKNLKLLALVAALASTTAFDASAFDIYGKPINSSEDPSSKLLQQERERQERLNQEERERQERLKGDSLGSGKPIPVTKFDRDGMIALTKKGLTQEEADAIGDKVLFDTGKPGSVQAIDLKKNTLINQSSDGFTLFMYKLAARKMIIDQKNQEIENLEQSLQNSATEIARLKGELKTFEEAAAEAKRVAEAAEAKRVAEEAEAKRVAEAAEAKRVAAEKKFNEDLALSGVTLDDVQAEGYEKVSRPSGFAFKKGAETTVLAKEASLIVKKPEPDTDLTDDY